MKNLLFVSAGQKRRRRKSRWSSGICVKRKQTSLHTSREDAQLATEEEEEGGDEEEADRGRKEEQMAMDVESGSTPTEGGRVGQNNHAAQDDVGVCERGKRENDPQVQNSRGDQDTAITKNQTEERKKEQPGAGNENGEAVSVDDDQGNREPSSSGKNIDTGNKIIGVEEEEPTQAGTVREDPSAGERESSHDGVVRRGDADGLRFRFSERPLRCMTRGKKNAVMQQQVMDVDTALQILEQGTPPLVVDRDKLKVGERPLNRTTPPLPPRASMVSLLPSFL